MVRRYRATKAERSNGPAGALPADRGYGGTHLPGLNQWQHISTPPNKRPSGWINDVCPDKSVPGVVSLGVCLAETQDRISSPNVLFAFDLSLSLSLSLMSHSHSKYRCYPSLSSLNLSTWPIHYQIILLRLKTEVFLEQHVVPRWMPRTNPQPSHVGCGTSSW